MRTWYLYFVIESCLSPLPGIYFYIFFLPSTYFVIESCLSPLWSIYFYKPFLPGTYFAIESCKVHWQASILRHLYLPSTYFAGERFCACVLQLLGIEVLGLSLPAAGHADTTILITCVAIQKLVKPFKNGFFWTQFAQKRGHYGPCSRWKIFFFTEITKADHQLSESFYFIKISYVLTELWTFFYLEWCFLSKKCHFQWKQLYKKC